MASTNKHGRSDDEVTRAWKRSGYFKGWGKRAGRRFARRKAKQDPETSRDGKERRETKRLP